MLVKLPSDGPLDGWAKASEILWVGLEETDDGKFYPAAKFSWSNRVQHLTFRPLSEGDASGVVSRIAGAANGQ